MQSVSPSSYRDVVRRTREALPGGVVWTSLLTFLLTLAISKSTAAVLWVPGTEVVPLIALAGAILLGLLALTPIPWAAGVGVGLAVGAILAGLTAGPTLHTEYPNDLAGFGLMQAWWGRVADGSAIADAGFDLFLISLLMWVTGGWLAWCVLRWRRPLLGLVPGAAAFATNILNFPRDQNGYVLAVLVLTLALLLWSNYTGAIASATRAHVKLTGDARWDFWESGLVAMAALIVLAIMLPPLSTVDRTVDMESSVFTSWAQLLQTLNHTGQAGPGLGGIGTTGFSPDVLLNPSLKQTHDPVFTYTVSGEFVGPHYFRGVDDTLLARGTWKYSDEFGYKQPIQKGEIVSFYEDYLKLAYAGFNVRMISPPAGNNDIIFYPGRFYHVDRLALATESMAPPAIPPGTLVNIDRLSSTLPRTAMGGYGVTVQFSTATAADLQDAGTNYPDWVSAYENLPPIGYRNAVVLKDIHDLAASIVQQAQAKNPYDAAAAIEAYLRDPRFTYTLTPPRPTAGSDPLEYFLFVSKKGYCQFFATAMADMLRSLGIPSRLVSGFGPGVYDSAINSYVVRSDDAHVWVEVYFPKYGWIEFEPTRDNQNVYSLIPRGAGATTPCARADQCDPSGVSGPGGITPPSSSHPGAKGAGPTSTSGGGRFVFGIPDPSSMTKIVAIVVALLLLLFAAVSRYLRPRTVMGVWRRTLVLARLAGADQRAGETPFELGRRLAGTFPEASEPMRSLTSGFVLAAYAPQEEARSARASVMEAWAALRPHLLRRAFGRLRPGQI